MKITLAGWMVLVTSCFLIGHAEGASPAGDVVGKVTVGYQGWFACKGDGSPINCWWHWSPDASKAPAPGNVGIKAWPDLRAYGKTYPTGFGKLGNGQPAALFSSCDDQVVGIQFKWMADNGIDCAALQRFNPNGSEGPVRNLITQKVMHAAEANKVKFYIMYDISGWTKFSTEIKDDWTKVMLGRFNVTGSSAYAKQNDKPVVCIWGMGFNDKNHNFDAATCTEVIAWFKSQGCYVIGGVPTHWLAENSDSRPAFLSVYKSFDMLSPWMVGRIGNVRDCDSFRKNVNEPDMEFCKKNGIDYQPCVLPGDHGQRAHGDFMWHQFANMIQIGANAIYISMFDEYNEGNQIAPTAEDASMTPENAPQFFTLDEDGTHCSSDYYLRLTHDGDRMLKKEIPFTFKRPTAPVVTASDAVPTPY